MISDEERREVATRLRNQLKYMRENGEYYKNDLDLVECGNSAYRNIAASVEKRGNAYTLMIIDFLKSFGVEVVDES